MNKIETEFDKLKRYEDIETYYPPLDDIKDFLYELFGDRVESQKYIIRANKQIDQLTNNWNELEEWLAREYIKTGYEEYYRLALKDLYDKMKEIKDGNNVSDRD